MRRRAFLRAAAATAIAACAPNTTTPTPTGDVVSGMSLERKAGQLMSVAFHGTKITSSLEALAAVLAGKRQAEGRLPVQLA